MDLGRHGLRRAQPKCLRLPDGEGLPLVSVHAGARDMTPIVVTAAVIERAGRVLVTKRQTGCTWPGTGSFRAANAILASRCRRASRASSERNWMSTRTSAKRSSRPATTTRSGRVELHFLRCELAGEPVPQLGQEMRWVPRQELGGLEFPPADTELIRMLTEVD